LTTFSIANDVAKYFAIIPAAFNALIIIALIPLALKGVRYLPLGAAAVLQRHVWIYGVGGVIAPFPGIKLIDMILVALGLV
jgi:K+-transporting ATPase ATPase B chain